MPISIGRGEKNDIILKDSSNSIGRDHLWATLKDDGTLLIEHRAGETKSQTFVDGRPVHKTILKEGSTLQLGEQRFTAGEIIEKVRDFFYKDKTDFTEEFNRLIPVFAEYEKKSADLQGNWFLVLSRFLPMLAMVAIGSMPDFQKFRTPIYIAAVAFALWGGFNSNPQKLKSKKDVLASQYKNQLRCPKCRISLIGQTLAGWKSDKHCQNTKCRAVFFH